MGLRVCQSSNRGQSPPPVAAATRLATQPSPVTIKLTHYPLTAPLRFQKGDAHSPDLPRCFRWTEVADWNFKGFSAILMAGDRPWPRRPSRNSIESSAGQVAAELARRGVPADQRVTITIEPAEPDDWPDKARRFSRAKVRAKGWSDADIDRIIKEERKAVQPRNG